MVTRLRSFLAVLLIVGLSLQAAWSMAPGCEAGAFTAPHLSISLDVRAPAETADIAPEKAQECDRVLLNCPAALLPGHQPQLAVSTLGQSFAGSSLLVFSFSPDGPKRPPRSA